MMANRKKFLKDLVGCRMYKLDDDRFHDDEVSASCIFFKATPAEGVVSRSNPGSI